MTTSLQVVPFTRSALIKAVGDPRTTGEDQQDPAIEYLASYLTDLGARSFVLEPRYVDRHFVDDFAEYYARSFNPPEPRCARLHFFTALDVPVRGWIADAYLSAEKRKQSESNLQEGYLGFVVQRPLATARIGRTVLRTYPLAGGRHYEVVRPYIVNLAALRLSIRGLAYQQQDRGAAVCASTALWSALQRVAYVAGHRTPTPISITRAAGSPYAASYGLSSIQMASALSTLGYSADEFAPAENRAAFRAKIRMCLDSQLPVILLVAKKQKTGAGEVTAGHAVTVTGYNGSSTIVEVHGPADPSLHIAPIPMRGGSINTLYVHDDNLGSHAHYELIDSTDVNSDGHQKLFLKRGSSNRPAVSWWQVDEWCIESALVPKPEKLRQPVDSLFSNILSLRPLFESILKGRTLHYGAWFAAGVEYRRDLLETGIDRAQLNEFNATLSLPRHIGVIRAYFEDAWLLDFAVDVSEIDRHPGRPAVLAAIGHGIPRFSPAWKDLGNVAKYLGGVPTISAPAT